MYKIISSAVSNSIVVAAFKNYDTIFPITQELLAENPLHIQENVEEHILFCFSIGDLPDTLENRGTFLTLLCQKVGIETSTDIETVTSRILDNKIRATLDAWFDSFQPPYNQTDVHGILLNCEEDLDVSSGDSRFQTQFYTSVQNYLGIDGTTRDLNKIAAHFIAGAALPAYPTDPKQFLDKHQYLIDAMWGNITTAPHSHAARRPTEEGLTTLADRFMSTSPDANRTDFFTILCKDYIDVPATENIATLAVFWIDKAPILRSE